MLVESRLARNLAVWEVGKLRAGERSLPGLGGKDGECLWTRTRLRKTEEGVERSFFKKDLGWEQWL